MFVICIVCFFNSAYSTYKYICIDYPCSTTKKQYIHIVCLIHVREREIRWILCLFMSVFFFFCPFVHSFAGSFRLSSLARIYKSCIIHFCVQSLRTGTGKSARNNRKSNGDNNYNNKRP